MAKKKEETALVETGHTNLPAIPGDMMEEDAGLGFENMTADDMAIPFIAILQSGSPQLKRGEQKIEGADEGDIFNTVTNTVYNGTEGIYVIPCAYKKAYVEWTPREAGGGFVRQYDSPEILDQTTNVNGRQVLPNGNIIVDTAYHYVIFLDPVTGDYAEAVIGMSSTQLKKSRKWNSIMGSLKMTRRDGTKFTPPMFSHIYHLTTEPEKNELGAWSGWKIELYSQVASIDHYNAAKKFATDVIKGLVKESIPPQTGTQSESGDVF